ncbi:tRNA lysidine(34) synthetase TilS [Poseidonibacter lekithochrous]|uniref:tRNA lysidine(34) synthetase TilS n=1 Tax=Poseidonibacter lekithochrous TaxID=1904463 RepID=UPI0008FCB7B5|nr:tRNA lysidine(34) synthetase TilS [Poseidonibacter lekithochrous]QKJ24348.1 tRNA(Ile)-lysidine synthetase [Poseidonibacter lekithochrous]
MTLNFSAVNNTKNLLAFSAGVDSSALFFLLLEQNIPFDIAIVDYNVREQSKDEVTYAKQLAKKYNKKVFIKEVELENSNFEKKARDIRYSFFEDLIKQFHYDTLITAHQLNDKLEWFMMQMSKGAGIVELLGFKEWEDKNTYKIYKPLLEITKDELQNYLKSNNLKYFVDNSNFDEKYKRNYFRHNYSDKFLSEFKDGIKNSFEYLQNDLNSLNIEEKAILKIDELEVFKASNDDNINIRTIDINLKKRGVLLSKASRNEILRQKEIVISHKISVCISNDLIYIAPFSKSKMDKKFKEKCRLNKIPKNVRVYLYDKNIDPKDLVV